MSNFAACAWRENENAACFGSMATCASGTSLYISINYGARPASGSIRACNIVGGSAYVQLARAYRFL